MTDRLRRLLVGAALVALTACHGTVVPDGKVRDCVDTRDGERFTIDNKTCRDAVQTLTDLCVTCTDSEGRDRRICRSHEAWLKCVVRP